MTTKSKKENGPKRQHTTKKIATDQLYEPPPVLEQIMEAVAVLDGTAQKHLGRPLRPPNNILWGRRSDIANMFEVNWADIGWGLELIRNREKGTETPEAVRGALEPLRGKPGSERIFFLLSSTTAPATSDDVRRTLDELGTLREKLVALQRLHDTRTQHCRLVDRAVFDVSSEHKKELETGITHRIENRLRLEKECAEKQALLAARQAKLRKTPHVPQEVQLEVSRLASDIRQCNDSIQTELRIIDQLRKLRSAASPKNQLLARREAEKYHAQLAHTQAELEQKKGEMRQLEMLYEDQAAGFSQRDFWKFLIEKRVEHHPRKLAVAIAGLPEIGCRDSVTRCNKLADLTAEPHTNSQVFDVIARAWAKRKPSKPQPLVDLIRRQLLKVPKTRPYNGKRVPNYLHDHFRERWRDLEDAIEACRILTPRPPHGAIPYLVTAKFIQNVSRQRTNLERVLSGRMS
jgi:hypothetical protein